MPGKDFRTDWHPGSKLDSGGGCRYGERHRSRVETKAAWPIGTPQCPTTVVYFQIIIYTKAKLKGGSIINFDRCKSRIKYTINAPAGYVDSNEPICNDTITRLDTLRVA